MRKGLSASSDLLAAVLAVVDPLLAQFAQLVDTAAGVDAQLHLQTLGGQLSGAANLIAAIDLNVAGSYQAAIDQLTIAQAALATFAGQLERCRKLEQRAGRDRFRQFTAFSATAPASIPALNVTGLDQIKADLLAPLQALNGLLPTFTPNTFAQRAALRSTPLAQVSVRIKAGRMAAAIIDFFATIKDFITQLDLANIRFRSRLSLPPSMS